MRRGKKPSAIIAIIIQSHELEGAIVKLKKEKRVSFAIGLVLGTAGKNVTQEPFPCLELG